jgi:RimJ/RimL family protein N-acetyltransferase
MNQPEIAAGRLLLRPWRGSDGAAMVAAWTDPEIRRWTRYGQPSPSVMGMEHWVEWNREQWRAGRRAAFAIEADGALAGSITLRDFERDADGGGGDTAEVGYWIAPGARGRGTAPGALTAVSVWAFAEPELGGLGVRRVELVHSVDNPASCRVAQKAGFLHEGTLRESFRYADGAWHDEHLHARLRTDPKAE